jgi:type I restriction enzyme, S subunit
MSWEKIKMGDFLKNRDLRFKPKDPKIFSLKRIEKIDFSGNIYLSEKSSNTDMILVKKGDLVISGINVEKGAMAIYRGEDDITATIHYSSYEFDTSKIDLNFLKNFLKSKKFTEALKEQVPGGIKTEIKPKHILPLEVEIPTNIEEQKIIIKDFENRNKKVESIDFEQTLQLNLLTKLRQQILQDAVQGKLVPQDPHDEPASKLLERIKAEKEQLIKEKKLKKDKPLPVINPAEIPFEIPENWVWCRLGDLTNEIIGGYAFDSQRYSKNETNNQVIRLGNVKPNQLVLSTSPVYIDDKYAEEAWKSRIIVDDILITMTGTRAKRDYLFTLLINEEDLGFKNLYLNQRVGCFRFASSLSKEFLNQVMTDKRLLEPVFISATGAANQANIGVVALREIFIPVAPINEQYRIVAKINQLMTLCDELEQSIQQNQKYTQELLQVALKEALEPKLN